MSAIEAVAIEHSIDMAIVEEAVHVMWGSTEEISYDMAESALYSYYEAHEDDFIEEAEEALYS